MTTAFALALTVIDGPSASAVVDDVLVRGNAEQTVAELAQRLAGYLGRPVANAAGPLSYGLLVERTGEQLRPAAPLSAVDLLDGDTVTLLLPRGAERARRRPRWALDDTDSAR